MDGQKNKIECTTNLIHLMTASSDTIINDVMTIQEQFVVQLITCNLFKFS